jgi:hypothetical protein
MSNSSSAINKEAHMPSLDRYSESEIEESFSAAFSHLASMNRLSSYSIVADRPDDSPDMLVKVEVPGMCESPSIEEYSKIAELQSLTVDMVVDGKKIDMVLKETVYINEREYHAIYREGTLLVPVDPTPSAEGHITSLT